MRNLKYLLLLSLLLSSVLYSQQYKILESNDDYIKIEFDFGKKYSIKDTAIGGQVFSYFKNNEIPNGKVGEPWLPYSEINIGIPSESNPIITTSVIQSNEYKNKFILSIPPEDPKYVALDPFNYDQIIYSTNEFFPSEVASVDEDFILRYSRIIKIKISPYQFNPVTRSVLYSQKLIVTIRYNNLNNSFPQYVYDSFGDNLLKSSVINYDVSKKWMSKTKSISESPVQSNYWYNPNKNYFKIFLNKEGVYRLTYNYLISSGVPVQNVDIDKFEIFNDGLEIPVYAKDENQNGIFEQGDYLEFVGNKPTASPYSYFNLYNNTNIYWLSYEADTTGKRFTLVDGYPISFNRTFATTPHVLHFEKDTLYERLGQAYDDKRDFWYMGTTSGRDGLLTKIFAIYFNEPKNWSDTAGIVVRANMHGMTNNLCNPDHKVKIQISGQPIGEHIWDGPNQTTFSTYIARGSINIYPQSNISFSAFGDLPPCPPSNTFSDEVRINWAEIEYQRTHRADSNHFYFKAPPNVQGQTRFSVFNWQRNNMKIFVPKTGKILYNPQFTNDQFKQVLFADNITERADYYCVAEDYFQTPDSIRNDVNSDYRNTMNGADVLVITHPKFSNEAAIYKNFRLNNFPDSTIQNPRIEIFDINQIYDEFSHGLLNPQAVKDFIKYAFENYTFPAPSYVVLFGDMSYDYRSLIQGSRPNFIPSIQFHHQPFGIAASDNMFVAVSGTDFYPDLAIGRISCETNEEANILVNKIIDYPDDQGKAWKQNALLFSSGLNARDDSTFQFNNSNLFLDNEYVKKYGYTSSKVFRFPTDTSHVPFQGEGAQIRQAINKGGIIANYYGHGGGYQWDLVFNYDDIYQLENAGRLPFITSVTCLTAHFENQDSFGEQFNKVSNKGTIAFWGSSGLTYWYAGKDINQKYYRDLYLNINRILGRAIINAKTGSNPTQVALSTLLGDPLLELALPDKPDFLVSAGDISITPLTPVVGDTVTIKVKISNLGRVFPNDSVGVLLFVSSIDTSYYLDTLKLPDFGEISYANFKWAPNAGGLYNLTPKVNYDNLIDEMDVSDNEATAVFPVYDLGTPNIITPLDGFVSTSPQVNFMFADNGYYLNVNAIYQIEIDTSLTFSQPVISSGSLTPIKAILNWTSPQLPEGHYFWRTRIIVDQDSSNWSEAYTLLVNYNNSNSGYFISGKHLEKLDRSNLLYSDSLNSIILNISTQPPRPSFKTRIGEINFSMPSDLQSLSTITTDGTYIYLAHMSFYGGTTKIYKLGTGYNGTIEGQMYGEIPNVELDIWHQMFYHNGYLYAATSQADSLLKIDPVTGDTSRVNIPSKLLNTNSGTSDGAFLITSNGEYVYNLAYITDSGNYKYKIRVLDPDNNWQLVKDIIPTGTSYPVLRSFFVAGDYLYAYENYEGGFMRKINLLTEEYEEEWLVSFPFEGYYAWTYDNIHDRVFASVFYQNKTPKVIKFYGTFKDAQGSVVSHDIGPGVLWKTLDYNIENEGSTGTSSALLQGFNKNSRVWDTLMVNVPPSINLNVNPEIYTYLKLKISLTDSSFGQTGLLKIKDMHVDYVPPPEIIITKDDISFQPDTILQGFDLELGVNVLNVGFSDAESLRLDYSIRSLDFTQYDSLFQSKTTSILKSNSVSFLDTISTTPFLLNNAIRLIADYPKTEMFRFNNIAENSFYIARDSIKPLFEITFDGKEILNGDIISSEPTVLITLDDNSPLPLDTSFFTIVHNNVPIRFSNPDLNFNYTPYPNSRAEITWTPKLEDGRHILEVLAKDASNNFFDSTSSRTVFFVYNDPDLREVYNYPNPFADNTHFTFELRGVNPPEEFRIKIYTIAGRLIREINIPPSALQIGFNTLYWDGKDQDGDEIANGLYFYKIISKHGDEVKTVTQKLAKVK